MQEVFEKIIERVYESGVCSGNEESGFILLNKARQIVEQAAEGYNNGWIPCSERLPKDLNDKNIDCFLVTDGSLIWMAYYNSEIGWQFAECTNSRNKIDWTEIIAWQPLPEPYDNK